MTGLLRTVVAGLIASFVWSATASAQTVEVAPGVRLTKRNYDLPINEQPFYGFAKKNQIMLDADKKFIESELKTAGTPEKAYERSLGFGWQALGNGYADIAARRFNQASLFTQEPSTIYHAFAVIAYVHLKDAAYAEELFKIALTRSNPRKELRLDFGRFLLVTRRPADALPVLEQAVIDAPDQPVAWITLGHARLETGNRDGACAAVAEAAKRPNVTPRDIEALKTAAKCA
jgi:predicted Zn-dependent protease